MEQYSCTACELVDFVWGNQKWQQQNFSPKWSDFLYVVCMVRCIGKESILQDVCVCKKHYLCLYRIIFIVNIAVVLSYLYLDYNLKPVNLLLWNQPHWWQDSVNLKVGLWLSLMFQTFKVFWESVLSHTLVTITQFDQSFTISILIARITVHSENCWDTWLKESLLRTKYSIILITERIEYLQYCFL